MIAADKIIERAALGEEIPSSERRHAIAFLMATRRELTNQDMADMFRVSERTVRNDKTLVRQERSKNISEDDITLVISDILQDYDRIVRDISRSKNQAKLGSRTYLDHCNSEMKMRLDTVKALQELGYYPKSLGQLVTTKYEYIAIVNKGHAETRSVTEFDNLKATEGNGFVDAEVVNTETLALPEPTEGASASQEADDISEFLEFESAVGG